MRLTFDSETTGVCQWKLPPNHPTQPRIVQLGALLKDSEDHVVAEMNLLVKPNGWTIPDEAAAIHGITTEKALRYGLKIETVIKLFIQLVKLCDLTVAHNSTFDELMVAGELMRAGYLDDLALFKAKPHYCTMQATTPICKLPGRYGNDYKWPSLQEAHTHLFGVGFEGGHDAQNDVRACDRVYEAIPR